MCRIVSCLVPDITDEGLEKARSVVVGGERMKSVCYIDEKAVLDKIKIRATMYDADAL